MTHGTGVTKGIGVESKTARVLAWLDDAFAMERALAEVLHLRAEDATDEELVRGRILRHLEATRGHTDILRECMRELGGAPSSGRTDVDQFGAVHGMLTRPYDGGTVKDATVKDAVVKDAVVKDAVVKDAISDYASVHFAIASYRVLVEALRDLGRHDLADRLVPMVRHEEDMAEFLQRQLPVAVRERLADTASTA